MKPLRQHMHNIRDLAAVDGIPAHMHAERLAQIREIANSAMIENDGLDLGGDAWGDDGQATQGPLKCEGAEAARRGITARLRRAK